MEHFDIEKAWDVLYKSGIRKLIENIEEKQDSPLISNKIFVELYTAVYNICTFDKTDKYPAALYDKFEHAMSIYINDHISPLKQSKLSGIEFLKIFQRKYQNFSTFCRWMTRIFAYLDRFYVKETNKPQLKIKCEQLFRLIYPSLSTKLRKSILTEINKIRSDFDAKKSQKNLIFLKNVVQIYKSIDPSIDLFKKDFEHHYLYKTFRYYSKKMTEWRETLTELEILYKIEEHISFESVIATAIGFRQKTSDRLMKTMAKATIVRHEILFMSGSETFLKQLIEQEKYEDLEKFQRLCKLNDDSNTTMIRVFKKILLTKGIDVMAGDEKEKLKNLFESLLSLYEKFNHIKNDIFQNYTPIERAFTEAWKEIFMFSAAKRPISELFAAYYDMVMTKNNTSNPITIDNLKNRLKNMTFLTRFLHKKKIFSAKYKQDLADRLLFDKSVGINIEKFAVDEFEKISSPLFSNRVNDMITDFTQNDKLNALFYTSLSQRGIQLPSPTSFRVLSSLNWPADKYKSIDCVVTKSLNYSTKTFDKLYQTIFPDRSLRWSTALSTAVMNVNLSGREVTIKLSVIQASILLLMNTCEQIDIISMKNVLNIGSDLLKRQLKPLVHKKYYGILVKIPLKGYDETHILKVNLDCDPPTDMIDISNLSKEIRN